MSEWLNNTKMLWKKAVKPCHALAFCPYGKLIEEFPLHGDETPASCQVFGHDCPVFYHAEPFSEDLPEDLGAELEAFDLEMDARLAESKKSKQRK